MKKIMIGSLLAAQLLTQLHAGGDIEPAMETAHSEAHAESPFYVVVKGLMTFGDKTDHETSQLNGKIDYGFGIDLGYRIGHGFAVEYDFSYSSNIIEEKKNNGEIENIEGEYYTSAIDLVYTYELTEELGVFAKVGFEYEWEKIDALDVDTTDSGAVFGVGFEAEMDESFKMVVEYEHSTIEGPRGDSLFAGVMYNF